MKKILALVLALTLCLGMFAGCQGGTQPGGSSEPKVDLTGTYDVTLWVSELEGVADLTKTQIEAFMKENPGIVINAQIEGVTEADAGSKVIADVASAPDIYCFAQDQLARLVQASALASLGKAAQATVAANNDAGSVAAGTVAGTMYAYPMTSDNGYYMYYDKSIISEEEAEDLASIVAACEKSGKKFRYALENAWYTASFFFATGCHSNWTMNQDGEFTSVDDTFNSPEGIIAYKGMQILTNSSCYDSNADIFTDAAVVITGIWNANAAADHFGDNLGATDLPSFTVDGKAYHLGSYTGNKLMGVKPQNDAKKAAVLSLLAQYLTNEQCQLDRYNQFQWGPSNKNAQSSEAVQANLSLAALAKQGEYGQPQGQIHGSWWDIAKLLGADAKAGKDAQESLNEYDAAIDAVLNMSDDAKMTWSLIGSICGTMWDTDINMTQVNDTTWETEAITLNAGEEFKLRRGAAWVPQIGVTNDATGTNDTGYFIRMEDSNPEPSNIKVETTGTYIVRLEWDGTSTACTVSFVPAN